MIAYGPAVRLGDGRASSRVKNRQSVGTPICSAAAAGPLGGVGAGHRDAALHEVPQQIAVIARELDHEARRVQLAPVHERQRVLPGVARPAVGGEKDDERSG